MQDKYSTFELNFDTESMEIFPVSLTREKGETFGLFYNHNCIITALVMGTPAQSSGKIRVGDKIYAINGEAMVDGKKTYERLQNDDKSVIVLFKRIGN